MGPPKGAFGEEFPQNIISHSENQSVAQGRVRASPTHLDPERIDYDGLPHIGAAIWPGQTYYNTLDRISSELRSQSACPHLFEPHLVLQASHRRWIPSCSWAAD